MVADVLFIDSVRRKDLKTTARRKHRQRLRDDANSFTPDTESALPESGFTFTCLFVCCEF